LYVTKYTCLHPLTPPDSPIAPLGSPPQPSTNTIYHEDQFSSSKPKYLTKSSTEQKLAKILGTSTAAELRALEVEATKRLPEMKRRLKGTQLGFFEQGIVTSLVFVLTTLVSGTGLLGYYGIRYWRS
jgi:hypothetical protein